MQMLWEPADSWEGYLCMYAAAVRHTFRLVACLSPRWVCVCVPLLPSLLTDVALQMQEGTPHPTNAGHGLPAARPPCQAVTHTAPESTPELSGKDQLASSHGICS